MSAHPFTPKAELPLEFLFTTSETTRSEQWETGELRDEWYNRYRLLFDEDCYRTTEDQLENHFNEWFAAIELYEQYGWFSLGEGYEYPGPRKPDKGPPHPRKVPSVKRILEGHPELLRFVLLGPTGRRELLKLGGQCPDMLCYAPDFSDWFFCEAKKVGEDLTGKQEILFPELEARSGQPIRFAYVEYR